MKSVHKIAVSVLILGFATFASTSAMKPNPEDDLNYKKLLQEVREAMSKKMMVHESFPRLFLEKLSKLPNAARVALLGEMIGGLNVLTWLASKQYPYLGDEAFQGLDAADIYKLLAQQVTAVGYEKKYTGTLLHVLLHFNMSNADEKGMQDLLFPLIQQINKMPDKTTEDREEKEKLLRNLLSLLQAQKDQDDLSVLDLALKEKRRGWHFLKAIVEKVQKILDETDKLKMDKAKNEEKNEK
jgi:hypothetical protein